MIVTYPLSLKNALFLKDKVGLFLVGNWKFSTRTPASFTLKEIKEFVDNDLPIEVLVNHFFHENDLEEVSKYLQDLKAINVKKIRITDVGVIELCQDLNLDFEINYASETLFTSYGQIPFWLKNNVKTGVIARELKPKEYIKIGENKQGMKLEAMIHGHMLMMQSKRPLISNYKKNFDYEFDHLKEFYFIEEKRKMPNIMYEDSRGTTNMYTGYCLALVKHLKTFENYDQLRIDNIFQNEKWTNNVVEIYYNVINKKLDPEKAFAKLAKLSKHIGEGFFGGNLYDVKKK